MGEKPEAQVTPEQYVAERRKWPRKRSLLQATLVTANGWFDCRVLDFSPGGAKVEFAHPLADKQPVTLIIEPIGTFTGVVAWRGNGNFGMQFLAQSSRASAARADIAAAVAALRAPTQTASDSLAEPGSRSPAEPNAMPVGRPSAAEPAPSSTDAAAVRHDQSRTHDAVAAGPLAAPKDAAPAQQAPAAILKQLCEEEKVFTLRPGDVLFREADPASRIYIVGSGLLRIQNGADEASGGDGVLGELGLAQKHMPRSPSAYALTECEVVEIDAQRFMELIEERPGFAAMVMQVVSRLLRNMGELGQWMSPGNSKTEPSRPNGAARM